MEAYIARQPIFNRRKKVVGYELLYRDGQSGNAARITDGDRATSRLLSDAITLFGLPHLTNGKLAYVNFTRNLIMSDFVLLTKPEEVVVEILEDTKVDAALVRKLEQMKKAGYALALDDYVGDPRFDPLLPYVDTLKVDMRLAGLEGCKKIAQSIRREYPRLALLAEKVETVEDFQCVSDLGFHMFQGYFFQRPMMIGKKIVSLANSSYGRLLKALQRDDADFDQCARIIHSDVTLTYRMMQRVRTMRYYRGNNITMIRHALVMMGSGEVRRWVLLILARENHIIQSDELVRAAYFRGTFVARLMQQTKWADRSEDGFLLGMFSLLDRILGMSMDQILSDVTLKPDVTDALLGNKENIFSLFLQYVIVYEINNPNLVLPDIGFIDENCYVPEIYMECIAETDNAFSGMVGDVLP